MSPYCLSCPLCQWLIHRDDPSICLITHNSSVHEAWKLFFEYFSAFYLTAICFCSWQHIKEVVGDTFVHLRSFQLQLSFKKTCFETQKLIDCQCRSCCTFSHIQTTIYFFSFMFLHLLPLLPMSLMRLCFSLMFDKRT